MEKEALTDEWTMLCLLFCDQMCPMTMNPQQQRQCADLLKRQEQPEIAAS